jgi:hypothetical protein
MAFGRVFLMVCSSTVIEEFKTWPHMVGQAARH